MIHFTSLPSPLAMHVVVGGSDQVYRGSDRGGFSELRVEEGPARQKDRIGECRNVGRCKGGEECLQGVDRT